MSDHGTPLTLRQGLAQALYEIARDRDLPATVRLKAVQLFLELDHRRNH